MKKTVYLVAAILGAIVPFIFFGAFMMQEGVTIGEFTRQLFATLPASGFTADLLITSAVFWVWSFHEARLKGMRHWWMYVVLNLCIGLSCAFPAFLFVRQLHIERSQHNASQRQPNRAAISVAGQA